MADDLAQVTVLHISPDVQTVVRILVGQDFPTGNSAVLRAPGQGRLDQVAAFEEVADDLNSVINTVSTGMVGATGADVARDLADLREGALRQHYEQLHPGLELGQVLALIEDIRVTERLALALPASGVHGPWNSEAARSFARVVYGPHGLPLVGYDGQGQVLWVHFRRAERYASVLMSRARAGVWPHLMWWELGLSDLAGLGGGEFPDELWYRFDESSGVVEVATTSGERIAMSPPVERKSADTRSGAIRRPGRGATKPRFAAEYIDAVRRAYLEEAIKAKGESRRPEVQRLQQQTMGEAHRSTWRKMIANDRRSSASYRRALHDLSAGEPGLSRLRREMPGLKFAPDVR